MEGITLGEIGSAIAFIAGILAGLSAIVAYFSKRLNKMLSDALIPTNAKIDKLTSSLLDVDVSNCKNYLVQIIAKLDAGQKIDQVSLERFWENYDHYTQLGGNSYIHESVERLKKEGKL